MLLFYGNRRFVIGRAVFWDINKKAPEFWFTIDYLADLIYVCDTVVHCHEGNLYLGFKINDRCNHGLTSDVL